MRMPLSALTHVAPAAEGPGPVRQVFETLDDASAYREFCTQARAPARAAAHPSGRGRQGAARSQHILTASIAEIWRRPAHAREAGGLHQRRWGRHARARKAGRTQGCQAS